tara:strand:- start:877 stop:1284 length:408 start_codon:yes stop_codon:yes gene_type:complete
MSTQQSLEMFDKEENDLIETTYTKKIDVPLYVPTYKKPNIHELASYLKSTKLTQAIKNSNVTEEEKNFLIQAAYRHTIFNFAKIADYYAHAGKEMQELMEQSALVIVDFDKAIECGFVTLNDQLSNQYLEEQNVK